MSAIDENGVNIVMKLEDILRDFPWYTYEERARFIGKNKYVVKIVAIDEETNTVYVRSSYSKQSSTKGQLVKEIFDELKAGNTIKVYGRAVNVDERRVTVDILCQGIRGVCLAANWSKAYTRFLTQHCKKGEFYEFEIVKRLPRNKNKDIAFSLSRKEITTDPWDEISPSISERDVLTVKCIDRPVGKTYWWGVSNAIPNIEIMGEFNRQNEACRQMRVGFTYQCVIKQFNKEEHILKVTPFDIANKDAETERALKFLRTKKIMNVPDAGETEEKKVKAVKKPDAPSTEKSDEIETSEKKVTRAKKKEEPKAEEKPKTTKKTTAKTTTKTTTKTTAKKSTTAKKTKKDD